MESFVDRKERKKGEENNFYLILTNTKKVEDKSEQISCLSSCTFGLGASCSKLETLIYIEVIAIVVVEQLKASHKK